MAKRVFFNRRYKMPVWGQLYAVWAVIATLTLVIVFFTSVERVVPDNAVALAATPNGFSEGLFYELREAENSEKEDVILRYAERLKKKHGYTLRETNLASCRVLQLSRGNAAQWSVAAALQNGQYGGVFSVLVFLDRLAGKNTDTAILAALIFSRKKCSMIDALNALANEQSFQVFVDADNNTVPYDRIPRLRNLNLRRHFPTAYLLPERTHWVNILALTGDATQPGIFSVPAPRAKDSYTEALAANPLLRHPAVANADFRQLSPPVALYLGSNTQLHRGGFTAIIILIWLLAFIPLANALGTYRERIDLGQALTSGFLYGLAFVSYLLLLKLALQFVQSDLAVLLVTTGLIPAVFFPLRILQQTMLRAELNRPGLHLLVQLALTIGLFIAPASALIGLLQLTAASAYSRASMPRKLLRLIVVLLPLALLLLAARDPMGSFANFLGAYLPAFSGATLFEFALLSLVGGNLTALLFVPRERI